MVTGGGVTLVSTRCSLFLLDKQNFADLKEDFFVLHLKTTPTILVGLLLCSAEPFVSLKALRTNMYQIKEPNIKQRHIHKCHKCSQMRPYTVHLTPADMVLYEPVKVRLIHVA